MNGDRLEARDLSKRYGDVWALRDCSFQLPANRIIALVGANGAGKSTLMSIAAGLLPATRGEMLVGGRRVDGTGGTARDTGPGRDPGPGQAALPRLHRRRHAALRAAHQPGLGPAAGAELAGALRHPAGPPLRQAVRRAAGPGRPRGRPRLPARPCCCWTSRWPTSTRWPAREVTGELLAEVAETGMTVMLSTHIVAELAGVGDHLLLLAAGRPVLAGDVERTARRPRCGSSAREPTCRRPRARSSRRSTPNGSPPSSSGCPTRPRPPVVAPGWTPAHDPGGTGVHLPQGAAKPRRTWRPQHDADHPPSPAAEPRAVTPGGRRRPAWSG